MTVFLFGTVTSPSCVNFALKQTAQDNEEELESNTIESIYNSFYVDDFLDSRPNAEEAIAHVKNVSEAVAKGGFKLTKWASNSRVVLSSIPEEDRAKDVRNLDLKTDDLPIERALGMAWNANKDTLCFRVEPKQKPATRQGMLSVVNTIFDPLGIIQPIIQPMKVLMQSLCRKNFSWDTQIPHEYEKQWKQWLQELPKLNAFNLQRCFHPSGFGKIVEYQLHHFSDASEESYGAASYIRMKSVTGQLHCAIISGKSRLVPLKGSTIPRLELAAATISAKNDVFFRDELKLPINSSHFWTDSTTVLRYLANTEKQLKIYVANRVNLIKATSDIKQWHHVPSNSNIADIASRGLPVGKFLLCHEWKQGPDFLWKDEQYWPKQPAFLDPIPDDDPELKTKAAKCFATSVTQSQQSPLDRLIEKCSNWYRLRRIVAWIVKYKRNLELKTKTNATKSIPLESVSLSTEELHMAEILIIQNEQNKYYAEEIAYLKGGKGLLKSSPLQKLQPFIENGLLRVGGRVRVAPVEYDARHPIIIPRKSKIAPLIIEDVHVKTGHNGREYVLAEIRQKFWIVKGSSLVRSFLRKCVPCRKLQRKPESQKMADLPENRLIPDKPPFTYVALDCFGPFLIKRGRSELKRYGVLFTCLVSRAIHIEIAHNLDTSSFIMSLRRFIARRGQVREIRSDNGTNFVSAERELRNAIKTWNQNQINDFLLQKNIKWIFQTPLASHHGGVFERQIRSVRKVLNALCREQMLTEESLITLMCECEAIVNGRPITTVSSDPNDLTPLTPNSLLLMKNTASLPPGTFDVKDNYSRRRWRQTQYLADCFWTRWRKEFLPLLQTRQRWNKTRRNLVENDIVLVVDDKLPRNAWLLGRVIKTYPDAKGIVRSVSIQTKTSVYDRPITKLILLRECDD